MATPRPTYAAPPARTWRRGATRLRRWRTLNRSDRL
nr:MAG TPA: hypothetical protein [Caudoviricetes sp.]